MQNKPKIRLYVEDGLAAQAVITLNAKQSHYLVHVMRGKEGQPLLVFNGSDGEWQAEISEPHKKHAQLHVLQQVRPQTASPDVWLCFAPVKNKNEIIIEKAVELGVSRIVPVVTQYCVVRSVNEERLQARIIEAAEQCGRLDMPVLEPVQALDKLLGGWQKDRTLFFADERGDGMAFKTLLAEQQADKKAVLIGPEGGFSQEEQQIIAAQPWARSFSMGPRILRADTAAIAALSCLMAWQGDWEGQPCYPSLAAGTKTS